MIKVSTFKVFAIIGGLLVVGFFLSLRAPVPGIADGRTIPVPADELLRLNVE